MTALRRAVLFLIMIGCLLVVAPVSAQSLNADDAALWHDAYAATFGQPLDYQLGAQVDFDGLHTGAGGLQLKAQGQLDLSGKSPALTTVVNGDLRLGSSFIVPLQLESRLVDGQLYLDTAAGWQTMPVDHTRVTFSGGIIDAPSAPAELALGAKDNDFLSGYYQTVPDLVMLASLALANPARQADQDGLAHFHADLDLPKLALTAEMIALFRNFSQNEGSFEVTFDNAKWAKYGKEFSAFLGQMTAGVDVTIDPATKLIRHIVIDTQGTLDPTLIERTDGPITLKGHLDLALTPSTAVIAAPSGAQTVDSFPYSLGDAVPTLDPTAAKQMIIRFGVVKDGESLTFPLDLKAGQTLTATARGMGLNFDTILTLSSADGASLATNDYHDDPDYLLGPNVAEIKNFAVPADGTYQLKVDEYDHAVGAFVLTVDVEQ